MNWQGPNLQPRTGISRAALLVVCTGGGGLGDGARMGEEGAGAFIGENITERGFSTTFSWVNCNES